MDERIFGHFEDTTKEFVIDRPDTPWPWINYLGDSDFFSLISGTAGGYSFCKDAKFRRITRYRYNGVPMDGGGRCFYIKDGPVVWNPGWKPCKTPLDFYECRHGLGYTKISGEKDGIRARLLFFVPLGWHCEVQKISLSNRTACRKDITLFSFVEWCLWNASTDMENFQRNLSTGEVEIEGSSIYHKTEYRERRNHYAFYSVNVPIDGFDTDRESFIGLYNGFEAPSAVLEGKATGSVAHGWSPIASHQINISLEAGETKEMVFLLGYVENPDNEKFIEPTGREINSSSPIINKVRAYAMQEAFSSVEQVDAAFAELRLRWESLLGKFQVSTGDERLDRMVNIWNQYQCMLTFNMARTASFFESGIGRGIGFRDSNQDLAGFVHLIPGRARQQILDIAATQFPDGSCYHQYQPLTRRGNNGIGGGFNDDPLWLIFGTAAYIKETGDSTILKEMVPFDNVPGSERTLMEHLDISFRCVADNLGPHGLPLIGRADWNDCLNLNCFSNDPNESFQTTENHSNGSKAESLMIAGLFVCEGREYAEILGHNGESDKAGAVLAEVAKMEENILHHGWDGEWFLRAYDFKGGKIGSKENDEGRIYIESQGWCVMGRVGVKEGYCTRALDAVKKYLDCPDGIVMLTPAYSTYKKEYGEITSYPQGYKENAGIFCHNNPWIIIAEALEGRAEDAWEHYRKICPSYIEDQKRHKVEPYVYCQMISGKDAPVKGEGKNSWLTGTAAWSWKAVSEYLIGIRPQYDGIEISVCLPPALFPVIRVHRVFRDAVYDITIHNSGSGKTKFIEYSPGEYKFELYL